MQGKEEENLSQIREEHIKRVYDLYDSKAKSFRNLLTGLMIFTLAFFFLVLLPYFAIQKQRQNITQQLELLPAQIEEKRQHIAVYQELEKGIQLLQQEIVNSPDTLRQFIRALQESNARENLPQSESQLEQEPNVPIYQQMEQQQIQEPLQSFDPCESLMGKERVECKVHQKVLRQFNDYDAIINQQILGPLQRSPATVVAQLDTSAIRLGFDSLKAEFNRKLEKNPKFWRSRREKEGFFVELDEEMKRFWKKYGVVLESQSKKLRSEFDSLTKATKELEGRNKELMETKQEVTARLSQIESPLGKLPVGINEAILVYPLVLVAGFWLCTSLFGETARLRRAFHKLYKQKDPQQNILTDQQVALVAPLWVDPLNVEENRSLKFAVLLLPLIFFIIACSLIFYLWALPKALFSPVPLWVYGSLYVLSLGFFGYGYWQIKGALRQGREE